MDGAREVADGKRMVYAAKEANVKHFIWSSVDSFSQLSEGKYTHVDHFDSKNTVEVYLANSGRNYTAVLASCSFENSIGQMALRKDAGGEGYTLNMSVRPDTKIDGFEASADMGTFVKPVLLGGANFYGKKIPAAAEEPTIKEMIDIWSQVTGKKGKFKQVDWPAYQGILQSVGMPERLAVESTEMFLWFRNFGYYNGADLAPSHEILLNNPVGRRGFVEKEKNNFQ